MRFEALILEKYGAFENLVVNFKPGADLHLVLGANEAGKSTSLQAIGDLLFSFPPKIGENDNRICRFKREELRVGGALRLGSGAALRFRRKSGRLNTLLEADAEQRIEGDPVAALCGAIDKDTFELDFGLNARTLREGAQALLAANGRLAETLASGSAGLAALNRLKGGLTDEANKLYASGARAREFNLALARYLDADRNLRDAIVTGDALKRAQDALEAATQERSQREEAHREAARSLARLERANRTRHKLQQLREAEEALQAFADLPPASAAQIAHWFAARDEVQKLSEQIAARRREVEAAQAEAAALAIDPALLEHAGQIDALRDRLGAELKALKDLPGLRESVRIRAQEMQQAAADLGLASREALVERLPGSVALAKVQAVLNQRTSLEKFGAAVRERLARARGTQQELQHATPVEAGQDDPAELAQTFEAFAAIPGEAARLREMQSRHDEALLSLHTRAARLDPPGGALETLLGLPLPDVHVVEEAIRLASAHKDARRDLERRARENAEAAARKSAQLSALSGESAIRTLNDWREARSIRDRAAETLEALANAPEPERRAALIGLRHAIAEADRVAEDLLDHADRAAQAQALKGEITALREEAETLRADFERHRDEETAAHARWQAAWRAGAIEPLAPAVMQVWLKEVRDIRDGFEGLGRQRADIAAAREKLKDDRAGLAEFAAGIGIVENATFAAEALHDRVRRKLQGLQQAWAAGREHALKLEIAARQIASEEEEIARHEAQRVAMLNEWRTCMEIIALPASAGLEEGAQALAIWRGVAELNILHDSESQRVADIVRENTAFEDDVEALAARLCPDLAGESAQRRVEALIQRLQQTQRAQSQARQIETGVAKLVRQIAELAQQCEASEQVLIAATDALKPRVDETLADALARAGRRQALMQEIETLTRDLGLASDGIEIADLRAEQEGLDPDLLAGDIERLKAAGDTLLKAIAPAAAAEETVRQAFERLCAGRNAPQLAQDKAEAEAELLDIARRWLVRAASARLAGRAIERHRQQAQDPIVANIGQLFSQATGGAFSGLVVDYDESDQPVFKALRPNGDRLKIAALSEGAADQLFLALRIALLQARGGEPIPFIGDDLLTSFDDRRTGHALDMLAGLGPHRQTILFTHHRHVADIAAERLGGRVDIIEIGQG